jgi:hypothetical protein
MDGVDTHKKVEMIRMSSEDDEKSSSPLAHLFATVERGVAEIRSGEITGRDVRANARERRMNEREAWAQFRGAARLRGGR